jgi:hypothetical protein
VDSDVIARPALGSLAALVVLAGQLAVFVYPDLWIWGLALTLFGLAMFLWARLGPPFRWGTRLVAGVPLTTRRLLIFLAVLFSLTATWFAAALEKAGRSDYAPALALWLAAGLALLVAFAQADDWPTDLRVWLRQNRREILLVAGVTLLGAAIRFYKLGLIPFVVEGDGGRIGQVALSTARGPLANPFATWESMGGGYLQGIALSMLAFGRSLFALRLLPAIGGSLAVPALYLLGRRLFGPRVALMAGILLATSHSHVHFSRTVAVSYTQGTFLVPLMLYFLLSGLETKSSLRMAAAAVILSIHFSIYVDSVIFMIYSLVFLMVARVVARPLMRGRGPQVAAFLVAAAIMLLPQTYYAVSHPAEYLNRFYADGAVQSGWLADKVAETGQSSATILGGRVVHAFLSLFYYPAEDFYGTTKSMIHFMTTALFLMGLAFALWRTRDPHFMLVNGYLFAPAVAIGLTAIPPSADSYRMLTALPAAVLLAGVGLEELMRVLTLPGTAGAKVRVGLSGLLLLAISLLNLKTYFVDFAGRCRYGGDPQTRFASYLGEYLRSLDPSDEVFLLSDEVFQYGTHGSVDFLSGGLAVQNFPNHVQQLRIAPGRVVIASPPRINELREWIEDNPGGTAVLEHDCTDPILMGYRLP